MHCWLRFSFLGFSLLACAPGDDSSRVIEPSPERAPLSPVDLRVRRAVERDCDAASLDVLRDDPVDRVWDALERLVAEPPAPLPDGLTRGIQLPGDYVTVAEGPTIDVLIPEGPRTPRPVLLEYNHPSRAPMSAALSRFEPFVAEPTIIVSLDFETYPSTLEGTPTVFDRELRLEELARATRLALRLVARRARADLSRVWTTGVSASAQLSLRVASTTPDRFAAVVYKSGGFSDTVHVDRLRNLMHLPMYYLQGGQDENTTPDSFRLMTPIMRALGLPFVYEEDPEAGHSAFWGETERLARWAARHTRSVTPTLVHLGTHHFLEGMQAYWLGIDGTHRGVSPHRNRDHTIPEALARADWQGDVLRIEGHNLARISVRWARGDLGAGHGRDGATLRVEVKDAWRTEVVLREDPTVAVRAFCETGDVHRRWAGEAIVEIPDDALPDDPHTCTPGPDCEGAINARCCVVWPADEAPEDWCDAEAARESRSVATVSRIDPDAVNCRVCVIYEGQPSRLGGGPCPTEYCATGQCRNQVFARRLAEAGLPLE